MSTETDKKFQDIAKWYLYHKNDNMPLEKKVEFLQTMVESLFVLNKAIYEDMLLGDGARQTQFILPAGLRTAQAPQPSVHPIRRAVRR
jgi:hypothetical protein